MTSEILHFPRRISHVPGSTVSEAMSIACRGLYCSFPWRKALYLPVSPLRRAKSVSAHRFGQLLHSLNSEQLKGGIPSCLSTLMLTYHLRSCEPSTAYSPTSPCRTRNRQNQSKQFESHSPLSQSITKVLAGRIASLIECHSIPPCSIAAITFTKKAADELRARLARTLGGGIAQQIRPSTLHALCARNIRLNGRLIDINENYTICNHEDRRVGVVSLHKNEFLNFKV